jgi:DNA helicase-2/ATP-dependent DNA helicase PcrA
MKRSDLTPLQKAAVKASEPVVLVLGGPGCGKTTAALWAARSLLEKDGTPPWQRVLFLTFSRAAVGQIARRLRGTLERGSDGRIEIATFHGFAYRLLAAFGRYAGHGPTAPKIQSPARARLLGQSAGRLAYDELISGASRLLATDLLTRLTSERWPLVICDEFQDTSDEQWDLLKALGRAARLLLFADPHQMIYTFVPGVGPQRLEQAKASAGRVIELEPQSHRDTSGVIPAMADSVRRRRFDDDSVTAAVGSGRLTILRDVTEEQVVETIVAEAKRASADGLRSLGIFAHSNEGVAHLSAGLGKARLDHVLVGIPESHVAALTAMTTLCQFAVGSAKRHDAHVELATFLTACSRGGSLPELAVDLVRGNGLDPGLARRFQNMEKALLTAGESTMQGLVELAARAWTRLGVTKGGRPWRRSAPVFQAIARPLLREAASAGAVAQLAAMVERRLPRALVDFDGALSSPVQLMNFHQTKGREADAVLLVYQNTDWFGKEGPPFPKTSRVLFVALTRARERVVIVLPTQPHPLVAPFASITNL